ncbi:hypothetical protein T439DRAFT_117092 [Meredithblackwellia eburnea MCA 4105]
MAAPCPPPPPDPHRSNLNSGCNASSSSPATPAIKRHKTAPSTTTTWRRMALWDITNMVLLDHDNLAGSAFPAQPRLAPQVGMGTPSSSSPVREGRLQRVPLDAQDPVASNSLFNSSSPLRPFSQEQDHEELYSPGSAPPPLRLLRARTLPSSSSPSSPLRGISPTRQRSSHRSRQTQNDQPSQETPPPSSSLNLRRTRTNSASARTAGSEGASLAAMGVERRRDRSGVANPTRENGESLPVLVENEGDDESDRVRSRARRRAGTSGGFR